MPVPPGCHSAFACLPLIVRHSTGFDLGPVCRGVMRWDICFNMCILRMLSYGLDLHRHRQSADTHKRQNPEPCMGTSHPRPVPEASPTRQHAAVFQEGDYSLLMYMAYVFYAPLYLAGPIITYQDFSWQLKRGSLPFGTTVSLCKCRGLFYCSKMN